MKTYHDKFIYSETFRNSDRQRMFSISFLVGSGSDDSYRGRKIKKAHKIAKKLRKLANILEALGDR